MVLSVDGLDDAESVRSWLPTTAIGTRAFARVTSYFMNSRDGKLFSFIPVLVYVAHTEITVSRPVSKVMDPSRLHRLC